jgi:hypothetical protein
LGKTVNAVPAEELTVSLFRETYPREMIRELKKQGAVVEKKFPGIYYVTGCAPFATQIVVTGQLAPEEHSSLRILSRHAREEDIRHFLAESENLTAPGDLENRDAVLAVSIPANRAEYRKAREEDMHMNEAIEWLCQDIIEEKVAAGKAEGKAAGLAEGKVAGKQDALLSSIKNLMKSMKLTAEQAMDAIGIPVDEQAFYSAKLK